MNYSYQVISDFLIESEITATLYDVRIYLLRN